MTYNVKLTAAANKDLQDIADYIALTLQEKEKAKRQIRRIREIILALETMSERYPLVKIDYLAHKGYRVIPQDNYLIFYRIDKAKQEVYISRVLYKKRDWKNIL